MAPGHSYVKKDKQGENFRAYKRSIVEWLHEVDDTTLKQCLQAMADVKDWKNFSSTLSRFGFVCVCVC